jgi:nucleoside-diphosphate-sugar epimerase
VCTEIYWNKRPNIESRSLKKKVLITGASGFIGSNLAQHLHENNYYLIGMRRNKGEISASQSKIDQWIECDLCKEDDQIDSVMKDVDYVIHLAGNAHEKRDIPYSHYREVNVQATARLVEKAAENSVKKFIFISTIKVNGENTDEIPFTEISKPHPQDHYSRSKYEAEKKIVAICKNHSMNYVIIRPPLVYGIGVRANFLSLMHLLTYQLPLPFASITNRRSFIYAGNLVDLIEKCLISNKVNNNLYLAQDISMSLPQLLDNLAEALEVKNNTFRCPVDLLLNMGKLIGKGDVMMKLLASLEVDDSKIRVDLGWEPPVSYIDSIRETASWYKNELEG